MTISIIAAVAENRVIGHKNQLPWHLPNDLRNFKALTLNKPVIMGRKTFESIGKPLPGRENIIITRQQDYPAPGCQVMDSLEQALEYASDQEEVMIIGGANIYEQALPHADRMYITQIHCGFNGDALFPEWNEAEWREVKREDHSDDNLNVFPYSFLVLERLS